MNTLKKIFIFFFSCFIALVAIQCKKEKKSPQLQFTWKADNPQTIPFRLRDQLYKKGNLVGNPSFEEGKIFFLDSINTAFNLPGWQKVGTNVTWAKRDTASSLNKGEVNTGRYAIKISRNNMILHESIAEGIRSDYIKLIPGNYLLSFYVKLKNVRSFYKNYGNLKDVLDVRIEYFDKNKIKLVTSFYDADVYSSYNIHARNNNAAFSCINDFNWGKVIIDSHHRQDKGGNIPDDARYAKIFLGFRGKGNVWFDDVSLRLSKYNFSYLERINPFFDSTYTPYELIIPKPKTFIRRNTLSLYDNDSGTVIAPAIVIPYAASKKTRLAAEILKEEIEALYADTAKQSANPRPSVPVLHNIEKEAFENYSLIFSIGKTALLSRGTDSLPFNKIKDKQDGYIIYKAADKNVIYLAGNNPTGDIYAVSTIKQLFDKNEQLYFHADIIDYPDFYKRPYVFSLPWDDDIQIKYNLSATRFMMMYKMNFSYLNCPIDYNDISANLDPRFLKEEKAFSNQIKKHDMSATGLIIHLPLIEMNDINVNYEHNNLLYSLPREELQKINNLKNKLQLLLSKEVKDVTIVPAKFDYSLVMPNRPDSLNCLLTDEYNTLAYTHAILVNHLYYWLKKYYPHVRLQFCTPWFCSKLVELSQGKGEAYFNTLMPNFNKNITLLWTGSENITTFLDDASIEEYQRMTGCMPVLFNNLADKTVKQTNNKIYSFHQKAMFYNIFNSLDVNFPSDFYQYNQNREIIINTPFYSELDKIKYMTIADYLWNSNEYNADQSLYKSLIKLYGKSKAHELIVFNDHYYAINVLYNKIKQKKNRELYKKIPYHVNGLNKSYNKICGLFSRNEPILKELEVIKREIITAINELKEQQNIEDNSNIDSTN